MERYSIFIAVLLACLYFAQGSIAGSGEIATSEPDPAIVGSVAP